MSLISLSLKNISKRLGPNLALDRVATEFMPATLHGLIGPDGAGKTTLMRIFIGLLRPDAGEIVYRDGSQRVPLAGIRPQMAYMPQQQSLYPDLSISEHLEFFRDLYRIPGEIYLRRKSELLQLTRLDKFQDRPAGQLSGGMYKKLGLMCALLQSPNAVFLDEPTNGVDPISRREFWDLLYRLVQEKILVVVSTAYMDEAERCGQVHVLDGGRLVAAGEPQTLLRENRVKNFEELFLKRAKIGIL